MFYSKTVLDNGITVLTEHMESVRSATIGIWIRTGSRDEQPETAGMSHFMEHMVFKGTPSMSALDISMAFDALGAELNAFTSHEYTCFYTRLMDRHTAKGFEMLSDMVANATFAQEAIDTEREVVIEEIARYEDMPEDHIGDVFNTALLPTHPLGRPILGTRDIVGGFETADMRTYHDAHYTGRNIIVSVSGNVDHEEIVTLAKRFLGHVPAGEYLERPEHIEQKRELLSVVKKETEQAHLIMGMPSIAIDDPRRYTYTLLDAALGGSMSSRLFQEVREKRGLVYSVWSSTQSYEGMGVFSIYAGTRPSNIEEVISVIRTEVARMAESGVSAEELERVRELVCGNFVLGMESTRVHMSRLGKAAVHGIEIKSIDETLAAYRAVTVEDVNTAAADLLSLDPTVALISPYESSEIERML